MNFKKYHVSRNLFDKSTITTGAFAVLTGIKKSAAYYCSDFIPITATSYYFQNVVGRAIQNAIVVYDANKQGLRYITIQGSSAVSGAVTFEEGDAYIRINCFNTTDVDTVMVNEGSTSLPYEPYSSEVWHDIPHYIHKTDADTFTTLPAVIHPTGTTATVGLKGQAVQSGTPTPDNPIMPQGTGERTGNLYISEITDCTINSGGRLITAENSIVLIAPIVQGKTYSIDKKTFFAYFNNNPIKGDYAYDNTRNSDDTFTAPITGYVAAKYLPTDTNKMINEGSTALPYEPYGYKIPISSANTTTPVYLGEVQSTRRVKKLVLTGEENWRLNNRIGSVGGQYFNLSIVTQERTEFGKMLCSHYIVANPYDRLTACCVLANYSRGIDVRVNNPSTESDIDNFKAYLAAQYAAGTPVTVWYVLATPETAVVNEPLRKIGDYADTVSGITIPTTAGANAVDVLTTLKPSEVSANYHGWHPIQNVHVYPDSSWMPTSWEEFRKAVRSGKAQSIYPVGTKLYENWGDETSDAWIVVDYPTGEDYLDSDLAQQGYTNRVMLMEEKLNYLRVFDTKEAWLYVETAIPAGTYRFTIPNYDASYGGNKTYIFTSTVDVPAGSQLTLTWDYQRNPSGVQAYSSSTSTTALFNVSIAEWDGTTPCTDLGTIKFAMGDADSTYGKLNHIHRARYGSNNYYQSGLRQWLNADATANNWWTPTNIFDRPYDNRNTAGRLNTLNGNMKAVLATPTVNCITNNLFEYSSLDGTTFSLQTAYTVKDKLFLVTHTETNLASTPNVDSVLDYYTNAQNADRIKYRKDNGNAYYWWLRTPYPTYAFSVRGVVTSGALSSYSALSTNGSAAACIIQ